MLENTGIRRIGIPCPEVSPGVGRMLSRSWFCLLFVCGKACVADALVVVMPYTPVQCETIPLAFFAPRTFHPAGASRMAPFAIIGAAQTRFVTHTRSPFNSACSACMLRSQAQGLPCCRRETLAASSQCTHPKPSKGLVPCIRPNAGIRHPQNACTSRMMAYPSFLRLSRFHLRFCVLILAGRHRSGQQPYIPRL